MVFAQLDDEWVAMRQVVARFAEEHIAPYAASWDEAGHFPRELVKPLAELGLVGLTVPQALGGTEASRLASAVVYEALTHADLSPVVWLAVHNMVAGIIATCGTDAQRALSLRYRRG